MRRISSFITSLGLSSILSHEFFWRTVTLEESSKGRKKLEMMKTSWWVRWWWVWYKWEYRERMGGKENECLHGIWDIGIKWDEYDMIIHGHTLAMQEHNEMGVTDVWIMESMRRYEWWIWAWRARESESEQYTWESLRHMYEGYE